MTITKIDNESANLRTITDEVIYKKNLLRLQKGLETDLQDIKNQLENIKNQLKIFD